MIGNKKLSQFIRQASSLTTERAGRRAGRSLHLTGAACLGNTLIGAGKLIMGILSLSLFTCVSAFYTFGMVTAKCCALAGIIKEENSRAQYRYYKMSGAILITASLLYVIYSARLFFFPSADSYHIYIAIGIAAVVFSEITLNIRGVIMERHNHSPLVHAIKMINLASSLISLVLTQTAILSFTHTGESGYDPSFANGLLGVIMGGIATLLGVVMIIRINGLQKTMQEDASEKEREVTYGSNHGGGR